MTTKRPDRLSWDRFAVYLIEVLGASAVLLLTIAVFAAAIVTIAGGVMELAWFGDGRVGIAKALKGIEYLFLAPMVLLSYLTMVNFVHDHFPRTAFESSRLLKK